MNLCVDVSAALQQGAGIGRYGRELLRQLVAQADPGEISTFRNNAGRTPLPPELATLPAYSVRDGNKPWRLNVAADYALGRGRDALLPGVGLFYATDHLLPRLRHIPSVLTVHDLSYLLLPQYHSRLSGAYQRHMMPRFVRQARHIIAPSNATKRDIVAHYNIESSKITVIPEAINTNQMHPVNEVRRQEIRRRYELPERYMLYLGTLEPRKNVIALLEAFAALIAQGRADGVQLVLAGRRGWLYKATLDRINELGLASRVQQLGFVPDEDLPALYAQAELFAFPSFYEGFGLPPLEAMACGTPVVASNTSSLPEVVGDAGLLVAPNDYMALAEAINAVIERPELRFRLRQASIKQAACFSWERTARETLALLREVALG
jgi:glycosyltransferase involved in cell wall biosynthesis